jgi:hypothetical protein
MVALQAGISQSIEGIYVEAEESDFVAATLGTSPETHARAREKSFFPTGFPRIHLLIIQVIPDGLIHK